jgi:myo-inositol 2-dehydrogenase/D-chiro-inositol 1-dehydrogenase
VGIDLRDHLRWPDPPVGVAVIGVGTIGAYHAENIATRVPGARLVGVADPRPRVADSLGARLGGVRAHQDDQGVRRDPAVESVVVASPAQFLADVIAAAAEAGQAVFCDKAVAHDLAESDRTIAATNAPVGRSRSGSNDVSTARFAARTTCSKR